MNQPIEHHSREQEKLFHCRIREWAVAYVQNSDEKMTENQRSKSVKSMEIAMKSAAKVMAYMAGEARFSNILVKGSRKLGWHDYHDLINIMEREFPRLFQVEPPPIKRDRTWGED